MKNVSPPAAMLLPAAMFLVMALPARAEDGEFSDSEASYRKSYSYSYVRGAEGPSALVPTRAGGGDVVLHQPVFVGDRVRLPAGSHLELELSDRNVLRLAGEAELEFGALAFSADTRDDATVLRVAAGTMQLIVPSYVLGDQQPRVDTPDASIYIESSGVYRVAVSAGRTELVVRDGRAEMVGAASTHKVHPEEIAVVEGGAAPRFEIQPASGPDALELWGERLNALLRPGGGHFIDESLRYMAAPLERHGDWVRIGDRQAWRPRVTGASWRPFTHGSWHETPSGLTWVSSDPWGHVTHHYGSWDYARGQGWVWYPGPAYSPADVFWYVGPDYVGWSASGYYSNYYDDLGFGLYGRAGGSFRDFAFWNFVTTDRFEPGVKITAAVASGAKLAIGAGSKRERAKLDRIKLDKGWIIRTTIPGGPNPGQLSEALRQEARQEERASGRNLPDVTDFVARRPLPDEVIAALGTRRKTGEERRTFAAGSAVPARSGRSEERSGRSLAGTESRRTVRLPDSREVESRPAIEISTYSYVEYLIFIAVYYTRRPLDGRQPQVSDPAGGYSEIPYAARARQAGFWQPGFWDPEVGQSRPPNTRTVRTPRGPENRRPVVFLPDGQAASQGRAPSSRLPGRSPSVLLPPPGSSSSGRTPPPTSSGSSSRLPPPRAGSGG